MFGNLVTDLSAAMIMQYPKKIDQLRHPFHFHNFSLKAIKQTNLVTKTLENFITINPETLPPFTSEHAPGVPPNA